jgi:hypothetical protein
MSAKTNNVHLDATALAALQEAAARRRKTLDEMASEAVIDGLRAERLNLVRELLVKGHHHGKASGIPQDSVLDVIHADREERGTR